MSLPTLPDVPDSDDATVTLPPSLRFLKWLVIALTLTMILGVITVVALLVTRMPTAFSTPGPSLPEDLTLPEGVTAEAVTFGKGWVAVVTQDDRILIFGSDGQLRQDLDLNLDVDVGIAETP